MSTINRMLRTRERMQQLFAESESDAIPRDKIRRASESRGKTSRAPAHGNALDLSVAGCVRGGESGDAAGCSVRAIGKRAFGAARRRRRVAAGFRRRGWPVGGCVNLLHATQLSLENIREEAALIRARQEKQKSSPEDRNAG